VSIRSGARRANEHRSRWQAIPSRSRPPTHSIRLPSPGLFCMNGIKQVFYRQRILVVVSCQASGHPPSVAGPGSRAVCCPSRFMGRWFSALIHRSAMNDRHSLWNGPRPWPTPGIRPSRPRPAAAMGAGPSGGRGGRTGRGRGRGGEGCRAHRGNLAVVAGPRST
jgi:hypothetical protein